MKTNYPAIVDRIHNEFNAASDALMAEAKRLTENVNTEKADRLKRVGFVNVPEVKKLEEIKVTSDLATLVEHYSMKYPNNKFITESQVMAICKKYKLVCAPIESYTGFVPETKLEMIERFRIDKSDERVRLMRITQAWGSGLSLFTKTSGAKKLHNQLGSEWIPVDHKSISYNGGSPFAITNVPKYSGAYIDQVEYQDNSATLICAPKKDMKLAGLKKIGSLFTRITVVNVPDPVVLKPCKGGFLIVCAWGDEASDPIVVNQLHN